MLSSENFEKKNIYIYTLVKNVTRAKLKIRSTENVLFLSFGLQKGRRDVLRFSQFHEGHILESRSF